MTPILTSTESLDLDPNPGRAAAMKAAALVGVTPDVLRAVQAMNDDGRTAAEWLRAALDASKRRAA